MAKRIAGTGLLSLALVVLLFAAESRHEESIDHWVGTWASSPQLGDPVNAPPEPGFKDSTLRQIVRVSVGGKKLRVRFSNAFGRDPLTLTAVHVAISAGGSAIQPQTDKQLTFHGSPSANIPAGALMVSDPLNFDLPALSDLAVTIHLNDVPAGISTHPGSRATSYLQSGDQVAAAELPKATTVEHWYFLNGIDVSGSASSASIVALGDSITDGAKSTTNKNGRWTDALARRLQQNKSTTQIGVLNEGIGGNRLLRDGLGPNALARFDRDVLAQTGVRWLIVLEGVNDLGTRASSRARGEQAVTVEELSGAYEQIIVRAHAHNIRVYGATILPFEGAGYSTPENEADRQTINQWIRTGGKFDGVIDWDAATRDAQHVTRLSAAVDSGDHLHPADRGYQIMGDTVDLKLIAKQ